MLVSLPKIQMIFQKRLRGFGGGRLGEFCQHVMIINCYGFRQQLGKCVLLIGANSGLN